jgi:AcrR family transcriptional regulator
VTAPAARPAAGMGRPRDPEVSDAAMAAAIRLIVDDGYPAVTMERIAERAGVSKAALYRRWPNKVAVVVDAVEAFAQTSTALPDTGRVRDDVVAFLGGFLRNRRDEAETFEALSAAMESDPALARSCRRMLTSTFAERLRTIVRRGVARGELPVDTDVDLVADLAPALIRYRRLATGQRPDQELVERIADQFFTAPGPMAAAG